MVLAALQASQRKTTTQIENIAAVLESYGEAAERMERAGCKAAVESTKDSFKKLLEVQAQLSALQNTMRNLEAAYKPPGTEKETDFHAKLDTASQEEFENSNLNAEQAAPYVKLLKDLQDLNSDDEDAADDEDDDLQIEPRSRALAKNATCPLSGIEVMNLENPVQDQKGFVYEREVILSHIRSTPGGAVPAPITGTSHMLTVADIKPAKKVIREQRRARNQPTQTQRADEDEIRNVD